MVAAAADAPAPADRDAARKLSQRQLELARRLDKIQSRMEEMLVRLEASDPLAAGTLADALDTARRLAIGGRMREAAAQLTEVQARAGPSDRAGGALTGLSSSWICFPAAAIRSWPARWRRSARRTACLAICSRAAAAPGGAGRRSG